MNEVNKKSEKEERDRLRREEKYNQFQWTLHSNTLLRRLLDFHANPLGLDLHPELHEWFIRAQHHSTEIMKQDQKLYPHRPPLWQGISTLWWLSWATAVLYTDQYSKYVKVSEVRKRYFSILRYLNVDHMQLIHLNYPRPMTDVEVQDKLRRRFQKEFKHFILEESRLPWVVEGIKKVSKSLSTEELRKKWTYKKIMDKCLENEQTANEVLQALKRRYLGEKEMVTQFEKMVKEKQVYWGVEVFL